ncbi:MAG: glycosyl transferase [Verrucomicrobiaceae bacterium]|nr:MAG: glycosyl transferase [Verrucomicrobiaceae bacterium]
MTQEAAADPPVRVFVGADRSQLIGVKVLEHSIKRHTSAAVELTPMVDLPLPQPDDPRHRARTGFSFSRFEIPKLAGYRGRALYLDADMLVFRDIMDLWRMPFGEAKVICQDEVPKPSAKLKTFWKKPKKRSRQTSVMVLDCGRLDWNSADIIAGLGKAYSYEQLMQELCILKETDISHRLPVIWNSLEHFDSATALLHYTDMQTQPWVSPLNKNGWLWREEVRLMLENGSITLDDLKREETLGYLRPSFLEELKQAKSETISGQLAQALDRIDRAAGFVPHATLRHRLSS